MDRENISWNKESYDMKQHSRSISEYYTRLRTLWEEIEAMNQLPSFSVTNTEVTQFLKVMDQQKEERRLFQFLNGLDEVYNAQRSQILLMNPLPTVESSCAMLHQEELQRQILNGSAITAEPTALYSRNSEEICSKCGNKGHDKERCWQVIGYPNWHPKSKRLPQKKSYPSSSSGSNGQRNQYQSSAHHPGHQNQSGGYYNSGNHQNGGNQRFYKGKGKEHVTAAHVDATETRSQESRQDGVITFSQQQFEQLVRMMPVNNKLTPICPDSEEEMDNFADSESS